MQINLMKYVDFITVKTKEINILLEWHSHSSARSPSSSN